MTLRQGGDAVIARMPVFLPGLTSRTGIADFYGFATALIDADTVLAGLGDAVSDLAIRGRHGRGADGDVFFGRSAVFEAPHIALRVLIPNGEWVVAAPRPGPGAIAGVLAFTGLVCAVFSAVVLVLVRKRQLAMRAIAAEQRRLEFVGRIGALGFIEQRPDGTRLISDNARCILGLAEGEDAVGAEVEAGLGQLMRRLDGAAMQIPVQCEISLGADRFGSERVVELVGAPASESGAIFAVRDISEAVLRRENATQTAKLVGIGQLAAGIAHELNTPLQYISDNLEYCRRVLSDLAGNATAAAALPGDLAGEVADELPQAIAESIDGTRHMSRIVGAIKSYASPGTDSGAQAFDVRDAVRQALVLTTGAYKHSAAVDVGIPDTPVLAWGNANDLAQVLINVVGNAYDAIDERRAQDGDAAAGHIALQVADEQDHCTLTVADDGCGLPPDQAERVFDLFFTTKPVGKGTGQGLSISLAIVRKYGGSMRIRPGETRGAIVEIVLPKRARTGQEPAIAA